MGAGSSSEKIKIDGICEKQYEPVKEHLLEMLTKGKEENVQLCVYVNGKCVVDLYGTAVGDTNYNHDKLQVFCILHEIYFEILNQVLHKNVLLKTYLLFPDYFQFWKVIKRHCCGNII